MNIKYEKDGIVANGKRISLKEITKKCMIARIKEENLILLEIAWSGGRGFDGIKERVVMRKENVKRLKEIIIGQNIYFGEIAGKHSEVAGEIEEDDITIMKKESEILEFLTEFPLGHEYNYSFLWTFSEQAEEGEQVTEEELQEFRSLW